MVSFLLLSHSSWLPCAAPNDQLQPDLNVFLRSNVLIHTSGRKMRLNHLLLKRAACYIQSLCMRASSFHGIPQFPSPYKLVCDLPAQNYQRR